MYQIRMNTYNLKQIGGAVQALMVLEERLRKDDKNADIVCLNVINVTAIIFRGLLSSLDVEPLVSKDCLCNILGSSTFKKGGEN